MTRTLFPRKTLLAAGSLGAALALLSLAPFNMGGCSASDIAMTSNLTSAGLQAGQALTITEARETDIGRNVALALTNRYGLVNNDPLQRYVALVGLTVADASPRSDLAWCFGVLNTNEVNAYSGPNGYVMITRGALARMQDESELAGVLGHEIGHVVKHHGKQAVQRAQSTGALAKALQASDKTAQFGQVSDFTVDVLTKQGFSQPEEAEADSLGVGYVAKAGYNPEGYLHFLQRMRDAQGGGSNLMSTHPGLSDRVQRVSTQITHDGIGGKGQTLPERFQANVPGGFVDRVPGR